MKTWTPSLNFYTPGDLSVSYSSQYGSCSSKDENGFVTVSFVIQTSSFHFTTASSILQVVGLPYMAKGPSGAEWFGTLLYQGITKSGVACRIQPGTNYIYFSACGAGLAFSNVNASDVPSDGTVILRGQITYCTKDYPTLPTVAFIGDSITHNWPLCNYRQNVINAGVSGNTTAQMLARFQADVLSHNPAKVVILGGTNDMGNSTPESAPSISNIASMASSAKSSGCEVVLCLLPPIDWENTNAPTQGGVDLYRGRQLAFNYDLTQLALANGYKLCDYFTAMSLNGSQNKTLFGGDTTHPCVDGYDVMWKAIEPFL